MLRLFVSNTLAFAGTASDWCKMFTGTGTDRNMLLYIFFLLSYITQKTALKEKLQTPTVSLSLFFLFIFFKPYKGYISSFKPVCSSLRAVTLPPPLFCLLFQENH